MTVHERRPVSIRHVTLADAGAPGAVDVVTASMAAQPIEGVNGEAGWSSGEVELRLLEEGRFRLTFPNYGGGDGVLHRDRFRCITDPNYAAGDEWIEVYEGEQPGLADPLFVGTPTDPTLKPGEVTLEGYDLLELYKTVRETNAGFWTHAPRDVFEHYTRIWQYLTAEDFAAGIPADWTVSNGAHDPATGCLRLNAPSGSALGPIRLHPGLSAADRYAPWRVDFTLLRWDLTLAYPLVGITPDADDWLIYCSVVDDDGPGGSVAFVVFDGTTGTDGDGGRAAIDKTQPLSITFEGRDRRLFGYVNGQLIADLQMPDHLEAAVSGVYPEVRVQPVFGDGSGAAGTLDLASVVVRTAPRFGLRGSDLGDYRLPGEPQPGGLIGSYFDDRDMLSELVPDTVQLRRVLAPTRKPVHRRIDPSIDFTAADPPAWKPIGVDEDYWSARWTGSIYLDLEEADRHFRLTSLDDGARLWIGKTRGGEELIDDWNPGSPRTTATSAGLRDHLGTSEAGWFPIVVEFFQRNVTAGIRLQDKRTTDAAGAWASVPTSRLSPQGIYEAEVRGDSHYEQLQEMARTFGLQYRVMPRALESERFPGELVPRVRVGRDVDKIIDTVSGGERERHLATRETVQALVIDAAGLAKEGAQLQHEQINFSQVGRHLFAHTDQISLAEITVPQVLARRAQTLQELRSAALEELGVRPEDARELLDSWPLTGELALFDFAPGDGALCRFDDLAVNDLVGRRLTAVVRSLLPDALGPPVVSFRPRPRSTRSQLRGVARQQSAPRRNDQGQITAIPSNPAREPVSATLVDDTARLPFPAAADQIIDAWLVVMRFTGSTVHTLHVNGNATGVKVRAAGRIPILDVVRPEGIAADSHRLYAQLVPDSAATGAVEFSLELHVRI